MLLLLLRRPRSLVFLVILEMMPFALKATLRVGWVDAVFAGRFNRLILRSQWAIIKEDDVGDEG